MYHLNDPLFLAIFNTPVARIIVKADAPDFTIVINNSAHQQITHQQEAVITGKPLFTVYERRQDQGGDLVYDGLMQAIKEKNAVFVPPFRYDLTNSNDIRQTIWWHVDITPVLGPDGMPGYLLITTNDVSDQIINQKALKDGKQREQELNDELSVANIQLASANEELAATNEELAASNEELLSVIAELKRTQEELKQLNDQLEVNVINRTKMLEVSYHDQQNLNEEITAINEELSASNEELIESQNNLESHIISLAESESRFRNLISQAPVGICVIRSADMIVQEVNDGYLEVLGRTRDMMENRMIWDIVPETAPAYEPIMRNVIATGVPYVAKEHPVKLTRNGIQEDVYLDFVYEPVKNANGVVISIMVVAIDVTDKARARQSIEDVEERIRLAIEAAEIGTFDYDIPMKSMVTNERLDQIFGFDHSVALETLISVVHSDDISRVREAYQEALLTGRMLYDVRLIHKDGTTHWIRLHGKLYRDISSNPFRILGTVLDITEFKRLQQQKDDFISIASHELKTPITSLKASLQLMDRLKDKPNPVLFPRLLDQSSKSMTKITELVDDLLNVSRMNEGKIQLNKSHFKVSEMLNECCNHVRVAGVYELIFKGDKELTVFADEHRIDQVVVNLVNNAVKYAPDSKEIYLHAEEVTGFIRIAVQDQGPGVSPDKIPYLFDRYYRADDSGFQVSGLGLGLYISAEIIQRHGGEIGVESELGKGSTFWFTLPSDN